MVGTPTFYSELIYR